MYMPRSTAFNNDKKGTQALTFIDDLSQVRVSVVVRLSSLATLLQMASYTGRFSSDSTYNRPVCSFCGRTYSNPSIRDVGLL